jgi:import receptor subunit TOM22
VGASAWTGARFAGKAAWILATTALVMALPLILEVDREQHAIEMEQQMQMQQQQQAMQPGGLNMAAPMQPGQGAAPQGPPLPPGVQPIGGSPA